MLNKEHVQEMLSRAKGNIRKANAKYSKTRKITVRVLDIEWLSSNFGELYTTLAKAENDILFRNELIKILITQQTYTRQIFTRIFIPYSIYNLLQFTFYSYVMKEEFYGDKWRNPWTRLVGLLLVAFEILFVAVEVKQVKDLSLREYVRNKWNWIEILTIFGNTFILLQHGFKPFDISYSLLVSLASVAIIFLYMKLFYWLRIFENLAYYVRMVSETIYDIAYFIILFVLCVFSFAHAVFVLNRNAVAEDQELYGPSFGFRPTDAIVNQYLLGLGEFNTDNFENSPNRVLIWIYFILATFLTNLTFLNMLIAIMGDTYARVNENKQQEALKERTYIYADYIWAITLKNDFENKKYLYIATPVAEEDGEGDEEQAWEGGIAQLKKALRRHQRQLKGYVEEQSNELGDKQGAILKKLNTLEQSFEAKIAEKDFKLSEQVNKIVETNKSLAEQNKVLQD